MSDRYLFIGILVLAAFLRLFRISEYMTFLGDEGRDAFIVYDILHGKFTLLGPTASVGGFFLGPIYYYFMAPFLWLFHFDPVGPAVMVALFGTATVYLVYRVGREFFNKQAGLIAALLFAISPLVIGYSRSSWNPNLMPFFAILSLYVLNRAVLKNRRRLFILCGVLLGVAIQLHYLATFLGVIVAAFILFTRGRKAFADYVFILVGFIVGWSPFLVFELRHGFPNLQSIIRFVLYSEETGFGGNVFSVLGDVFFRLFARLVTRFPPPEQVSLRASTTVALWYSATLLLALSSTVTLFYRFVRAIQNKSHEAKNVGLLVAWFSLGILLFGFYQKSIYDYYFGFMFALPFLLVGLLVSDLLSRGSVGRFIGATTLVALIAVNLVGMPFRFLPNRQKEQVRLIADFVLEKTKERPFNFALITGGNSDHGYRYFFRLAGKDPVTIENPGVDPKRSTVTEQLLIVCETPCAPLGHPLWEVAGFGRAEVLGRWRVSVVEVYKLVHYKGS